MGRLCLDKEYRGLGLGKRLVQAMEGGARQKGYEKISMHAQKVKIPFYQRCGYQVQDLPEFWEDGILHVHMEKLLE